MPLPKGTPNIYSLFGPKDGAELKIVQHGRINMPASEKLSTAKVIVRHMEIAVAEKTRAVEAAGDTSSIEQVFALYNDMWHHVSFSNMA